MTPEVLAFLWWAALVLIGSVVVHQLVDVARMIRREIRSLLEFERRYHSYSDPEE